MKRSSRLYGALAAGTSLVMIAAGTASADTLKNYVTAKGNGVGQQAYAALGGSVSIAYEIQPTGRTCDAADGSAATVSFDLPDGVSASPTTLTFERCEIKQYVAFSSTSAGRHRIPTATVTDAVGDYSGGESAFVLNVAGEDVPDRDHDGVPDADDNCPDKANNDQVDADDDGAGNACDPNAFAPTVKLQALDASGLEGSTIGTGGSFADGDADAVLTLTQTAGVGTLVPGTDGSFTWSHSSPDDATGFVTLSASDGDPQHTPATQTFAWTVTNAQPAVGPVLLTRVQDCVASVAATFTDAGALDTHTASIAWGDASSTSIAPATTPVTGTHRYKADGTYDASVTVTDDDGGTGSESSAATFTPELRNTAGQFGSPLAIAAKRAGFKAGSVIPVKIVVTACDGTPSQEQPVVKVDRISDAAYTAVDLQSVGNPAATSGTNMRFATDKWMYNFSTKNSQLTGVGVVPTKALAAGGYRITVSGLRAVHGDSRYVDVMLVR